MKTYIKTVLMSELNKQKKNCIALGSILNGGCNKITKSTIVYTVQISTIESDESSSIALQFAYLK